MEVIYVIDCQVLNDENELAEICKIVKQFVQQRNYTECEKLIFDAMSKYPHAPEPHNLIRVLLEKEGKHTAAMKHFRAAWALDPTLYSSSSQSKFI